MRPSDDKTILPRTRKTIVEALRGQYGHNTAKDMNEQNTYNDTATSIDELKEAAFEYLLLNPGSEFGDWQQSLISDYPTEVVDALGTDPEEVYAALADLWESDYYDPTTGIEQKYSEWAESFSNEASVGIYYYLVEACKKLKKFNLM